MITNGQGNPLMLDGNEWPDKPPIKSSYVSMYDLLLPPDIKSWKYFSMRFDYCTNVWLLYKSKYLI